MPFAFAQAKLANKQFKIAFYGFPFLDRGWIVHAKVKENLNEHT